MSQCVTLCAYRKNVYIDIGGFTGSLHAGGWPAQLRELFSQGMNHRVIFGTDYPLGRISGGLKRLLSDLFADEGPCKQIPRRQREQIFAGNLMRLLRLGADV